MINLKSNKYVQILFIIIATSVTSLHGDAFEPSRFWENYLSEQNEPNKGLTSQGSRSFFSQWFTGPMFIPPPTNLNPKHPAIEPTVVIRNTYGFYKNNWKIDTSPKSIWSMEYSLYWLMGINKFIGMEALGLFVSNFAKNATSSHFEDTILRIGFQILRQNHSSGSWLPDLRLIFQEIFPSGKYQNANVKKYGTDITGEGSFQSGIYLSGGKNFNYHKNNAFNLYAAVGYFIPSNVKVKGISFYGGDYFTNGKILPGNMISIFFSGEFEISKHISFAFDSNFQQNFSGEFRGNMGFGDPVEVPQRVFFYLSPKLEITIKENLGLLVGPWFSIAGQNTPSFISGFISLLYFF